MVVTVIFLFSSTVNIYAQQQGSTCNACSCQFKNVEVLTQLIESTTGESVSYYCMVT
jgi:hypothetical protein